MSQDLKLQQRVIDELTFEPSVDAAHIGVSARDGVITLTGHVANFTEKYAAERAVRRVKGVLAVAQELEVRLPSDKKTADDEIAARAVRILDWDARVPYRAITVRVERGVVTLSGDVDWQYQKSEAEYDIGKLSGVKSVINDIRLRPRIQTDDVKATILQAFERSAEFEAANITVDVFDRKIILGGRVQSWIERSAAERATWSVPGVIAVEDNIAITRP